VKERPIIFTSDSVRAILDGRKTQTRRVIKPQLSPDLKWMGWIIGVGSNNDKSLGCAQWVDNFPLSTKTHTVKNPYGQPGDRLWVRETWINPFLTEERLPSEMPIRPKEIRYRADGVEYPRWQPSFFMPRWASRITLEIVNVRVERVQDITEEDAIAEGIDYLFSKEDCLTTAGLIGTAPKDHGYKNYLWHGDYGKYGIENRQSDSWPYQYSGYKNAIGSYSSLWEKINAKRGYGWDTNPWVWVIEFRKVE
jgi:hypothetical protein